MANLPAELNYGSNKAMAAQGTPFINRYRSDNGSYVIGTNVDTVRIEIPCGRAGSQLFARDSFIEGKITVQAQDASGNAVYYIDQSIYSVINRMRILHGSTVLEDVMHFNKVITSIYDLQVNEVARRGDCITKLVNDTTDAAALQPLFNDGMSGMKLLTCSGTGGTLTTGAAFDFCFVLPSGLLGSLATKAVPLGDLTSSIYIELELAPANVALITTAGTEATPVLTNTSVQYTLSDIYFNCKMCSLPADVNSALHEATGGFINLPAVSYKSELKSTISTGTTAFSDKFAFQFGSIKNFNYFFINSATATGSIYKRSVTARPFPNILEWYIMINGQAFPSQSISNLSRLYSETLRAWNNLCNTTAGGVISYQNYGNNNMATANDIIPAFGTAINATKQKRFVASLDLDRFNHEGDVLMSGTSSTGQMVTAQINFKTAVAEALNLYAYVQYDCLFHVENGQLTPKW